MKRPAKGSILSQKIQVFSVIVGYQPNQCQLAKTCAILTADGASVVVIDNTEEPYLDDSLFPVECKIVSLNHNTGIAHAQNMGIKAAIADGADIIVLLDQDSTVAPGFLHTLISSLSVGHPGIVSPLCVDDINNVQLAAVRINKFGMSSAVYCESNTEPYLVDVVISSGIAVTREVFQIVGFFDEGLFIDFVDTEWCLRCRSKGVSIRVVPAVTMRHRIGMKSILLFGRFTVLVHSADRCYYQLRNCFHLFRKSHIPLLFALKEMFSVFFSRMLLLFILDRRADYFKAYLMAVKDGLVGVEGRKTNGCG